MSAATAPEYIHANALVLGEKGVLLRGPSGAGKSALTLALIAHAEAHGDFARLVGDDRVSVEARDGRLVARPHPSIAGLIEARGAGLLRVDHEPACVVAAIIDLCAPAAAPERYPDADAQAETLHGVRLPRLAATGVSDGSVARIVFFIQRIKTF